MPAELKIPLDYQRLPEFRQLVADIMSAEAENTARGAGSLYAAAFGSHLVGQLFVELGYQAQTTNRPGWLSEQATALLLAGLNVPFTSATALALLVKSGVLVEERRSSVPRRGEGSEGEGEGYFCAFFARHNAHLSGDFVPSNKVGNALSILARQKSEVAHVAAQTLLLLPGEMVRDRAGREIDPPMAQRAMRFIGTVDRALRRRSRENSDYGNGVIADAVAVVQKWNEVQVEKFFEWLMINRDKPNLPKNTEQLLPLMTEYMALALK